jgi:flagellar protein FlaG
VASVPINAPQVPTIESGQAQPALEQTKRVHAQVHAQAQDAVQVEIRQSEAAAKNAAVSAPPTLEESVKSFREFLKNMPSDLQFQPDQESGVVIFKVINPLTREVIRQYPPDEVVAMARKLKALEEQQAKSKSGIFLDQRT